MSSKPAQMSLFKAVVGLCLLPLALGDIGYNIATPSSFDQLERSSNGGALYQVNVPDAEGYDDTLFLLQLKGSHYEMGYDQGYLIGDKMAESVTALLTSITGGVDALVNLAEMVLERQWRTLQLQTPQEYLDEIQGLSDGSKAAGHDIDAGNVSAPIVARE